MERLYDSTDRSPTAYVLFAVGFSGIGLAATGVVLASKFAAILGLIIVLLVLYAFWVRSAED